MLDLTIRDVTVVNHVTILTRHIWMPKMVGQRPG